MTRSPFHSIVPPKAKRSLGQNFLIEAEYIERLIGAVDPTEGDRILEIGPGRGAITERLVASGSSVLAIELDRRLIEPLNEKFAGHGNFTLIEQDVLDADLENLLADFSPPDDRTQPLKTKLIANLPYYISTSILQRLAKHRHLFSFMVLMFQREVADRITAKPGSSGRGFLTVLTESAFGIERLFDVPPAAFRPIPKVWSSVLRLVPKAKRPREIELEELLSTAFGQKRKTISNNLRSIYPNYQLALGQAAIDPKARAEQLTLEDWLRLNDAILASG